MKPLYIVMDDDYIMIATHNLSSAIKVFNNSGCVANNLPPGRPRSDNYMSDGYCKHIPLTGEEVKQALGTRHRSPKSVGERFVQWNHRHLIQLYTVTIGDSLCHLSRHEDEKRGAR